MRTLGNVIWVVFAGSWLALGYVVVGLINCAFIITIPFGIQAFKLAGFSLWPFGRMVVHRPDRDVALGCVGNGLWFVTGGLGMALAHLAVGIVLCCTIIGIPFGVACFKLAGLCLAPFGKRVVPVGSVPSGTPGSYDPPPPLGRPRRRR